MGLIGIEAAVLGNHALLLGTNILAKELKEASAKSAASGVAFPNFLSANLVSDPDASVADLVAPTADFTVGDLKVRVIGLSTPEPTFQYSLLPGFIVPAGPVAQKLETEARADGIELVIALSHLGFEADKKLVEKLAETDLVVGGHSHEKLKKAYYRKNSEGRKNSIVQTGAHGLAVGTLLLDVKGPKSVKVVSYELHNVTAAVDEDPAVKTFIEEAEVRRNERFSGRWNETVGTSEIKLSGYENGSVELEETCWGQHMARLTREAVGADIGIHLSQFEGAMIALALLLCNLIDNFPHLRTFEDAGWRIIVRTQGNLLRVLFRAIAGFQSEFGVNMDGVSWRSISIPQFVSFIPALEWIYRIRMRDIENRASKIDEEKMYQIAFPAEIGYFLTRVIQDKVSLILPQFKEHEVFYWPLMESYVKRNSPLKCLK